MILCRITGTVVGSTRSDSIPGAKFLLASPCDESGKQQGDAMVVLDLMGAGPGEMVLVSQGSSVRQTEITKEQPVDAVTIGIVDQVERGGALVYNKDGKA